MSAILEIFIQYLMWPTILFLIEVLLRQIPSLKENSLFAILLEILDRFIPSKAKGGRKFVRKTEIENKNSNHV